MKNNRIKFELYNLIIDIELREIITIVSGNSGSGKTFLYNLINEASTLGKL